MKITEATFREILENTKIPVVAYFGATWCGPCKMFAPIFENAGMESTKNKNNPAVFIKMDVDECQQLCEDLNISAVPTVLVFENSQVTKSHQGAFKNEQELIKFVND